MFLFLYLACAPTSEVAGDTAAVDTPLRFRFPIAEPERMVSYVMGMDHDPEPHDMATVCTAFDGESFPWCYDGHDGSDYDLYGGFDAMDSGSATVVAGAGGFVESVRDGYYDRCHLDFSTFEPDCDGHEMKSNRVSIRHPNGYVSWYAHFKTDSIVVEVGQWVPMGEPLGLVGSSGYSTAPHLHFELEDPWGEVIDPYSGEWSQEESWWCDQGERGGLPATECGSG